MTGSIVAKRNVNFFWHLCLFFLVTGSASWHGFVERQVSRWSCIFGAGPSRHRSLPFGFLAGSGAYKEYALIFPQFSIKTFFSYSPTTKWCVIGSATAKQHTLTYRTPTTDWTAWCTAWHQLSLQTTLLERYAQRLAGLDSHITHRFLLNTDVKSLLFFRSKCF